MPRPLPFALRPDGSNPPSLLNPARVVVVEPSALAREALAGCIRKMVGFEVVALTGTIPEAIAQSSQASIAVLIVHSELDAHTLDAIAQMRREAPHLRLLVVAESVSDVALLAAIRLGVDGLLLDGADPDDLCSSIQLIERGEAALAPTLVTRLVASTRRPVPTPHPAPNAESEPLSARERDVLRLVASGMTNRQIGRALVITEGTVKNHVHNALRKLGLENRAQAAAYVLHTEHPTRRP